jgi:glycosyltransferase involved in cell wall biosynthesis
MSSPTLSSLTSSLDGLLSPLAARAASATLTRPPRETSVGSPASIDRAAGAGIPIVCFCHLSWNWVWQRPQQFLSRLAARHEVLFVETYRSETPAAHMRRRAAPNCPRVTVLEMHLPTARWDDGAFIDRERRRLMRDFLATDLERKYARPILWFYDPMAVTAFAGYCGEQLIVYDCMDELSQFKGAPPALAERERELLRCADVVFCGGRKMRAKRLPLNRNCHFYGTGVDCTHFGRSLSSTLPIHPDIASLTRPVLGYFGVIDERIDYDLLAQLADARRDWSIAMIGPVAKVNPNEFPQRPNLHWLGPRPYADLPAITKGFSVCLMPFALNAATEYINPTKALEYMAAGRPVVSTALDEVKSNFETVACVARSPAEFVSLCDREAKSPSIHRVRRGLSLAAENTWEAIAGEMENRVAEALAERRRAPTATARTHISAVAPSGALQLNSPCSTT